MASVLSPRSVRSLFSLTLSTSASSLAPSAAASAAASFASAPLSPSSARRSLALLIGHMSALLALFYCLCSRALPWLDWVAALGVEAVNARLSKGAVASGSGSVSAGVSSGCSQSPSSFAALIAPSPLLTGRVLKPSASQSPSTSSSPSLPSSSSCSVTVPSPSGRMAALRSRASAVKAVRLVSASPLPSQRSLSQPSYTQSQQQSAVITSPRKRSAGFSFLPSLLSPPLSRSPSAPPSPRSPSYVSGASVPLSRSVHRHCARLLASLHAEEDVGTLAVRVQLSNVLATVFAVGSLVMFLCMRALVSTSWSSHPLMVATLVCPLLLAFVPALNHYSHTTLSRLLLVLLVNSSLFLFTCSTPGHGFSTLFYGCMPLPLLLFDASLGSLPFLLSVTVPLVFHLLVTFVIYSSSLYTLNSFTSSVLLSTVLLHLVSSYQTTHQSLLTASRSSRAAHVAMTSLMHSISHELRTPLNAVCGYAELLLMDNSLAAPHHDMVKTIADNADALTKLVSDFLTFSSSSSGQLRVDAEIMDVEEMLDATVASHALQAHKKGVELVLEVTEDVPALVVGDGQRMREVLSNLLSNSIKASTHGCIHIRVSVDEPSNAAPTFSSSFTAKAAAPAATLVLRFDVRDEGCGITAEQQSRLFQPFQSLNPTGSSASTATSSLSSSSFGNSRGLGLAICHSLVQLMGGTIGVVSAPEKGQKGSLFYFTVQVHQVDMGEDATPTAAAQSAVSSGQQLMDAFDRESSDRKQHTAILPVTEGNELSDEENDTVAPSSCNSVFSPPRLLQASSVSCFSSPLVVSSSLVRHVLLVSPNRTARDVYARIFLQTRGWLVSLCEDEHEARLRLFDSPCQPLRQIDSLVGVNRATSSPGLLDEFNIASAEGHRGSLLTLSSCSTPRLFDCVVLDQVAGMDLATVQRFALNIQSRLDIPCVILKMANASSPNLHSHGRVVSGRQDDSRNCTPQSSPHSESATSRSLFDTTDEAHSAGPLSPAHVASSAASSATSTPNTLPHAPFLPRPPSLQKPHYSNITPPASHVQQFHSLVSVLVKPVKRKALVGKVRTLMEQARQRYASKRKRELRDRMQFEQQQEINASHQQAAANAAAAHEEHSVTVPAKLPELLDHQECKQQLDEQHQQQQHSVDAVGHFDIRSLPMLPTPPPSLGPSSVLQSCPPEPLSLPSLAAPLSRESSTDSSRPSPSMLRSLDRLTAAARSTSAPAMHAVFMPSRPSSGGNSPIREEIREEKEERRACNTQQQLWGSSPFSVATTASPQSSSDSPACSDSSSSRSSSAASASSSASSSDSPSPPQPNPHAQPHCHTRSHSHSPPHSHTAVAHTASSSFLPSCDSVMPASPPTSLSQLRVLVAEDTVTNQKIIGRMLQRLGVQHVAIVNDGSECLQAVMGHSGGGGVGEQQQQQDESESPLEQQARQAPYHVILMDLLMPVMDGWQATERLRTAGYDLPIVALSASAMKSDRVRCDEVGCSAFLSKPTKLADLKDTLERLALAQR